MTSQQCCRDVSEEFFYYVVFFTFPVVKVHQEFSLGLLELELRDFWVEAKSGEMYTKNGYLGNL